ncbi:hypothetical protein BaRGS_00024631 [Batillaria attramentaria]|uniref:Uncharacterized protein n=1 Tax=Batillaria attramentaria TaxID=370345 RepID=A0ABD0KAS7_9CAEN
MYNYVYLFLVRSACADGYSQHLAIVDQGCEINYCTQTPKLHPPKLPSVKRPPFTLEPAAFAPPKDNMVIFDRVSRTWHRDEKAVEYMAMIGLEPSVEGFAAYNMSVAEYFVNASRIGSCYQVAEESKLSPASDEASGMKKATQTAQASQMTSSEELPTPMSAGSAAAIAVVATLACVLLLAVGVLTVRAYQRRRRAQYRPLKEPQCIPHADYGAQSESAKMNGAEEYH